MFEGIIGHQAVLSRLSKFAEHGGRGHAFLFVGPDSVGKTSVAQEWTRALLNHRGALTTHPDYYELASGDEESVISIEAVRACIAFLEQKPFITSRKVALIRDAGELHPGASDALLKTLEEPPGDRVIIVIARHRDELSETIQSRCQIIEFGLVADVDLRGWVQKLEGATAEDAERAVHFAAGKPGRAVFFLENKDACARFSLLENGLAEIHDQGTSSIMRWVHKQFTTLKESDEKVKRAEEIISAYEQVLHARVITHQEVSRGALAALKNVRHALAHHVSPQHTIEYLLI